MSLLYHNRPVQQALGYIDPCLHCGVRADTPAATDRNENLTSPSILEDELQYRIILHTNTIYCELNRAVLL